MRNSLSKHSEERRTPPQLLSAPRELATSESMVEPSTCSSPNPSDWRYTSPSSSLVETGSRISTWESESEVVVPPTKSTLSDKQSPRLSSPTTRSTMTSSQRETLRKYSFNTTRPSLSQTPEDASPRNSVERVPDPDSRSLTDERIGCFALLCFGLPSLILL